jgi:hypothetical protein
VYKCLVKNVGQISTGCQKVKSKGCANVNCSKRCRGPTAALHLSACMAAETIPKYHSYSCLCSRRPHFSLASAVKLVHSLQQIPLCCHRMLCAAGAGPCSPHGLLRVAARRDPDQRL